MFKISVPTHLIYCYVNLKLGLKYYQLYLILTGWLLNLEGGFSLKCWIDKRLLNLLYNDRLFLFSKDWKEQF